MNKIARRSAIAAVLALVLILGFGIFIAKFCMESKNWVVVPGSPHIYEPVREEFKVDYGVAVDPEGNLLLDMRGNWTYTDNASLRKAIVHWVGDREGNIIAPALNTYVYEMTGHDTVNGIYTYGDQSPVTQLTLAASVQIAAIEALGDRTGAVAVYNYRTGQLICSVSTQSFDPDNLPEQVLDRMYVNKVTEERYIPGSIFKIVTLAAALETIPDVQQRKFTCQRSLTVDGNQITCEKEHGTQTLEKAFSNSCNCTFAQLALEVGAEKMAEFTKAFGLTENLSFDGLVTVKGNYQADDQVGLAWSGVGQGKDEIVLCSFLRFVGAIANDGAPVEPYVVESISKGNKVTYQAQIRQGTPILSEDTVSVIQSFMRTSALSYGASRFGELTVCAKTGTAQVEGQSQPNAMLAGFVTDPEYPLAFVVCVESAGYGNDVCVPIAGKVLDACKAYME